jgi:hypothetical protein
VTARRRGRATIRGLERIEPQPRRLAPALALLVYAALAVLLFARAWAHPATSWIGYDDDPHLFIWYLGWTPQEIAALRNPLFTMVLQAPGGVNLMWNTAVVAPAIVLWPVTAAFGAIASYNVLVTAAVALSAWCGFLAARRFVGSDLGAALAGLVYGFSPYMVAQSLRHPHVLLAVFPPLALILLHEILVGQRWSPLLAGGLLGAAAAVQFLTGEEILAYTALVAGLGVVLLAALHPAEVASRAPGAVAGLAIALGTFAVLAAYPLWFQFLGPQRVSGVLQPPGVYVNDLLGFFVPSNLMALSGGPTGSITGRFTGNVSETDAYVGIPLVALLVVACVLGCRRPLVRWAAPLAAAAALLSLGPRLHVGGTVLPIPLPGALVARLPLMESAVPSRLMLFAYLGIALVLADLVSGVGRRRGLALAAVAVALVPLVPRWPYPSTDARVPAFFQPGGEVARLSPADMVLVAPYADHLSSVAMLWQASSGYRFRMPEGEAFVPGPSLGPPPSHLRTTFEALEGGVPVPASATDRATTLGELAALDVDTVVAGPGPGHDRIVAYLTAVLGRPPVPTGGVDVWWDVRPGAASAPRAPG